jgi:hypothetical protein
MEKHLGAQGRDLPIPGEQMEKHLGAQGRDLPIPGEQMEKHDAAGCADTAAHYGADSPVIGHKFYKL